MSELVSILIPAYNAEKWIGDTIRSAINQTWPQKEIIIVNDGSRDDTFQIAKRFESKSVKVVHQENQGACAARNNALAHAQGNYIQWLDADDLLAPDKIARQLKAAPNGQNSRILLTAAFGTFFFRHQKAKFQPNALWQDLEPVEWIFTKLNDNVWFNPTSWLVSRKLTELAGTWDQRLAKSGDDDGEYICRIVTKSEKVNFIPEAKCYYRIGNLSSLNWSNSDEAKESLFLSLILCVNHLRSLEDSERTRTACINYLQRWLHYFYPEKQELFKKLNEIAVELGGSLKPPELKWKYFLSRQLFGYQVARNFSMAARKTKLRAIRNWDRFMYALSIHK
jgi:glycosyltransferase involved in cell wall biosynthesis